MRTKRTNKTAVFNTVLNRFNSIENSSDLQHECLTLADYRELERLLPLLKTNNKATTLYSSPALWLSQIGLTVKEKGISYQIAL